MTSLSSVAMRCVRTPTENEPMLSEKSPMPTWLSAPRNLPRPSCVTSTWDPLIAWCRPSKLSRLVVLIWIDRPIVGHPCC